jgi:hypothetical protein
LRLDRAFNRKNLISELTRESLSPSRPLSTPSIDPEPKEKGGHIVVIDSEKATPPTRVQVRPPEILVNRNDDNVHNEGHDFSRSPPRPITLIICAVMTVIFIIGGMVGLFFETESPKRIGLVIFLVTLLIILMAVRRARPIDIFLLSAAWVPSLTPSKDGVTLILFHSYAAVLVVFLSGDLAGPQSVVVVDISRDASLALLSAAPVPALATTVPSVVTSAVPTAVSSASGNSASRESSTPTGATVVSLTSTSVVVPSSDLPSPTSTSASTDDTQSQSHNNNTGKVVGSVIGIVAGVAVLALIGPAIIMGCRKLLGRLFY